MYGSVMNSKIAFKSSMIFSRGEHMNCMDLFVVTFSAVLGWECARYFMQLFREAVQLSEKDIRKSLLCVLLLLAGACAASVFMRSVMLPF